MDGDRVRLDYTDNGVGIPTKVLQHIFEPFFTTRLGGGGFAEVVWDCVATIW
ncbi:MAG: hypothetical protein R3F37_20770 [Candidatus Competibacteraceae bacterium]